jgi:hypothetical protein
VKKYLWGEGLGLPQEISLNLGTVLKYCPLTSVNVWKACVYKLIPTEKRYRLTPQNIRKNHCDIVRQITAQKKCGDENLER